MFNVYFFSFQTLSLAARLWLHSLFQLCRAAEAGHLSGSSHKLYASGKRDASRTAAVATTIVRI